MKPGGHSDGLVFTLWLKPSGALRVPEGVRFSLREAWSNPPWSCSLIGFHKCELLMRGFDCRFQG